jgi:anti-sigma factor RsiW
VSGEETSTPGGSETADLLVAYLDGELEPAANRDVEQRLAEDAALRLRLRQLQRSWDLLDALPESPVDEAFTNQTLATIAVTAQQDLQVQQESRRRHSRRWLWAAAAAILLAFLAGYGTVRLRQQRIERRLVRDLPVIEQMDEYRYADSVEFLMLLDQAGLFAEEEIVNES